jgi:O-antigen ligase
MRDMRKIARWLSLGLVFVIPFSELLDIPPLGTLGRIVGLPVMAFWLLTVIATGRLRRPTPVLGAAFLFVFWYVLSATWSLDSLRTLEVGQTYLQLLALLYIVWDLYTTQRAVLLAFQVYVLGCYVPMWSLVENYRAGITEASHRYTATGFNSNLLAMGLALGLPLAWCLVLSPRSRKRGAGILRLVTMAYLPIGLFAILLTASRAGFFGGILVLPLMALSLRRFRLQGALAAVVLAVGAGAVVLAWTPETSLQRLAGTGSTVESGDFNARGPIWRESLLSIAAHPLMGVGGGTHRLAARITQKVAHNFILGLGVEVGLIGLALFCAILVVTALEVRKLPRWDQWLWLTLFGIWLVNTLTHNWEDSKPTWLFLGLAVASANATRQRATSPALRVVSGGLPLQTSAYTDS